MCGIFGYVGKNNNAAQIILEGLKLLEYRGYDSWGIAIRNGEKIDIDKHVGKIGQARVTLPPSSTGIGHTRWATHGGVTVQNAHPHLDCTQTVAVVHNGIVENFSHLKGELLKKGHTFVSETDTEVASHLIEEYLTKGEFVSAVQDAFNRLKGMNAIVVLNAKSGEIIAAKNGSPLVVGAGDGEYFIASDAAGILKHTKKVLFLEDNQMAILGKKLKLLSLPKGDEIKPKFHLLSWKFEQTSKGKFKHYLLKEISEQPRVIEDMATSRDNEVKNFAKLIKSAYGTFMLGCGTASYAALAGVYLFSKVAKRHVNFSIGSEFKYLEDYLTPKSLIIPISQSGETIDVVDPVNHAKKKRAKIAAMVNVLGSTLYRQADYRFLLHAGPEIAVIGTKSFIAMVSALILLAYTLSNNLSEGKKLLLTASKNVKEILTHTCMTKIKNLAQKLRRKEHIYVLGRGLSYAAALEATLKIKETSYIHAEGFAGGELKHGVIALIEKDTPCIVFAPNDETYDEILSSAQEVKARGGFIIGIGPRNNGVFEDWIKTGDLKEATILSQVVIAQLLAYYLALARGIKDPDKPRNLAKSVTVK